MFAGLEADQYAEKIRARAPGCEALDEIATVWLQGAVGSGEPILSVGAGDGEDLVRLAQADPTWRLTLVAPEPEMLRMPSAAFASMAPPPRWTFGRGSYPTC